MTTSAALADLMDALDGQSDSLFAYVDRETGQVILISDESLSLAEWEPEEIESLADWQKEEAQLAIQIETTERYLRLPDRFEVNEWEIMRDFCDQVKPDRARATLQNVIHGNHPFRNFKDQMGNLDLWSSWNEFRGRAFEEILRAWREENGITLVASANQQSSPDPTVQRSVHRGKMSSPCPPCSTKAV